MMEDGDRTFQTHDEVLAWLAEPGDCAPAAVRARLRGWVSEYTAGS